MDPFGIQQTARSARRMREILSVLGGSGFDYLIQRMQLGQHLPLHHQLPAEPVDLSPKSLSVRSREALEQLGPTFIKFGQILSSRPDLVGEEFCAEFSKLQDQTPPFPYAQVESIVEAELGKPIHHVFKTFDKKPLASASIGQVHAATLMDGTSVVVKVQRPGIVEQVREDISIMNFLSSQLASHVPESREAHLSTIISEFERAIRQEMDYKREARHIEQFAAFFADDPTVRIPTPYPALSTSRVLVMERIHAPSLQELLANKKRLRPADRRLIARRLADAYFRQVMLRGLFHADPHPGNILVLPKDRICFLDFGMVGRIEPTLLSDLVHCFVLIIQYDVDSLIRQIDYMNLMDESVDRRALRYDLLEMMDIYYGVDLEEMDITQALSRLIELMRHHHLKVPREFVMLARSMLIMQGDCLRLDPSFNAVDSFKPYAEGLLRKPPSPKKTSAMLAEYVWEFGRFARDLPSDLRRITRNLQSGKMKIEFEHKNLDRFAAHIERVGNKVSIALILAALIIGSSTLIASGNGPMFLGVHLATVGFGISGLLGLWLVLTILRQ